MNRTVAMLFGLVAGLIVTFSATAQSERLQVVATHTILTDVVRNVAGDAADVTALMPANTDPHSFVPTPSDVARLADADVVFVNGASFEEGLLEVIENAAEGVNIVEASQCVMILPFGAHDHAHEEGQSPEAEATEMHDDEHDSSLPSLPDGEFAERCAGYYEEIAILHGEAHEHEGDHADEDAHEHEDGHAHETEALGPLYALDCSAGHDHEAETGDEHGHEEGGCDPHVWWEPHNVIYWTMTIRDTLAELDPANAETYRANAAAYIEALDALVHDEIRPLIESLPEAQRILVTDHDSLGYFAHAYGFEVVGVVIAGGSTLAEPSSSETATLIDTIRQEGVSAIVVGSTVSSVMADQVAAETGAAIVNIYTDSLSDPEGPAANYLDFMRYNARIIIEALVE
ncbi:MAG: zinc ABC transporter substrate-binding protein [Chloroflexi bacterium]|nr:zinc ABC transporter substrate-binding protein [Chloroflexota bacterium]